MTKSHDQITSDHHLEQTGGLVSDCSCDSGAAAEESPTMDPSDPSCREHPGAANFAATPGHQRAKKVTE